MRKVSNSLVLYYIERNDGGQARLSQSFHFYSKESLLPRIPQPYQNAYATKKFGDYFMQGRATCIKEAANLYEEELRYNQQQQQLRQINSAIVTNNTINAVGMAADAITDILFIASFF